MDVAQLPYDTKNQLLSEQSTRAGGYTFSFAYDPAQNPTTFQGQFRAYNANNQLVGTGFAYDGNGNPVLYKGVNLAFDPENRMTAYGNILTAGYNGDGLRAWKQTATGRRYYLVDGEELVCELDAAGNVVAPVVFGANGLVVYSSFIYQFDPQGNAVHLMNNSRQVLANLAYDAWGQLISGSNPTPYGYKAQWGYYTDAESGILLLTHRYLDPATGRFLTRDPIGFEGGINLYAYVGNGVVTTVDPLGLHDKEKCFEAIRKARDLARRIDEHLQRIQENLPPMASVCIPNEPCAAAPRRPDQTLWEKWELYRGHVKDVEGLRRRLEEVLKQIDNNCNNHWKNYFRNEIKYFEDVLSAPIPEWPGGVCPCIPLPYPWPSPIPAPFPIRPPVVVPV